MIYVSREKANVQILTHVFRKKDREYEILLRRSGKYKVIHKDALIADETGYTYIIMEEM